MKIVDALTFNKELDLLEGRLEYLYNHVDYFLIVESNYTHTGKEKPLYFAENASRFAKYADKILPCRLIVDKNYDFTDSWKLENQQRDFISLCLDSFDHPIKAFSIIKPCCFYTITLFIFTIVVKFSTSVV